MNFTTPTDGAYTYTAQSGLQVLIFVERGAVTRYMTGAGESATWASAERLNQIARQVLMVLAHELEVRSRVPGLMVPVGYCALRPNPAPEPAMASTAEPIGNALAHELHKELGSLGFGRGYDCASAALGRLISSLAALSAEDALTVRDYAYGQLGLSLGGWAA
jgi:hypothetical protein